VAEGRYRTFFWWAHPPLNEGALDHEPFLHFIGDIRLKASFFFSTTPRPTCPDQRLGGDQWAEFQMRGNYHRAGGTQRGARPLLHDVKQVGSAGN